MYKSGLEKYANQKVVEQMERAKMEMEEMRTRFEMEIAKWKETFESTGYTDISFALPSNLLYDVI